MAKRTDTTRLNVDFTDEQKAFLAREKEDTGVGQADIVRRILDSYMTEPPLLRAIRRDRSLTQEERVAMLEHLLKQARKRKGKKR